MNENPGILWPAFHIMARNKRYLVWFYILNLVLSVLGAWALRGALSGVLDNSLYSQKLAHGFDVFVFLDLISRPELAGHAVARPHIYFTWMFIFFSVLFMPGVLDAYSSERRLSREDFWATCGRNLWRFIRLFVINLIIAGVVFAVSSGINGAIGKAADDSPNVKLPFYLQLIGGVIIFLIMTWIRAWFDVAQAHVVVHDESKVRNSIRLAARFVGRSTISLLACYVLIAVFAAVVFLAGLWVWVVLVPPAAVVRAFLVGQIILFLWLAARFWQRACAVAFCATRMSEARRDEIAPAPIVSQAIPPSPAAPEVGPAL